MCHPKVRLSPVPPSTTTVPSHPTETPASSPPPPPHTNSSSALPTDDEELPCVPALPCGPGLCCGTTYQCVTTDSDDAAALCYDMETGEYLFPYIPDSGSDSGSGSGSGKSVPNPPLPLVVIIPSTSSKTSGLEATATLPGVEEFDFAPMGLGRLSGNWRGIEGRAVFLGVVWVVLAVVVVVRLWGRSARGKAVAARVRGLVGARGDGKGVGEKEVLPYVEVGGGERGVGGGLGEKR